MIDCTSTDASRLIPFLLRGVKEAAGVLSFDFISTSAFSAACLLLDSAAAAILVRTRLAERSEETVSTSMDGSVVEVTSTVARVGATRLPRFGIKTEEGRGQVSKRKRSMRAKAIRDL